MFVHSGISTTLLLSCAAALSLGAAPAAADNVERDYGVNGCYYDPPYNFDMEAFGDSRTRFSVPLSAHDQMTFQFLGFHPTRFDFSTDGSSPKQSAHPVTVQSGNVYAFTAPADGYFDLIFDNVTSDNGWTPVTSFCVKAANVQNWKREFGHAVQSAASVQLGTMGKSLQANSAARLGGIAPATVSQNDIFLSTDALDHGILSSWNAWFSAERRFLDGSLDGTHDGFSFGADVLVAGGDALVGVIFHAGRLDIRNTSGTSIQDTSYSLGPFFAARLTDTLTVEGHAAYGEPEYDVEGSNFRSERLTGNLSLYGQIALGAVEVMPFARISSFHEDQPSHIANGVFSPSRAITATTASAGARIALAPAGGGFAPYGSLAVEYSQVDDGFAGSSSFTKPRIGLGVNRYGERSTFSIGAEAGYLLEDTRDAGVHASFLLAF